MWTAVQVASDHGSWKKFGSAEKVADLKSKNFEAGGGEKVYYIWDAKFPTEPEKLQAVYDEMVAANGGIEMRVMVGAALSHLGAANAPTLCSGECFCVVQGNSRSCEHCWQAVGGAVCVTCPVGC